MLQLSQTILNKPVLSLRTGGEIATATSPLINPDNLKIEGFYCSDRYDNRTLILLFSDIREQLKNGFVVNDHEVLSEPEELVRMSKIINLQYQLIGKPVETVSGSKVGKVSDYAIESQTMYIQKLYVAQPIYKNLTGGSLSVDRTNIHEVTDKRVIINELLTPKRATQPATA